ncbi:MAG: phosphotransferase [Planctomycetes bacterium]|jgi:hypothetical protein|nr:phosphotransferase [Planctomycetota bacterium]
MPTPSATAGDERILHVSPARTVARRTDAGTGGAVVAKTFVTGSRADAEHELVMGRLASGPGVVEHLQVDLDPVAQRPVLLTRAEAGVDLDQAVADRGALPAAVACAWLLPVARTLERLHGLRGADAPLGLCHGDLKPKNLLRTDTTTLLLDFEHSHPIAALTAEDGPFAFGTAGFTAPEVVRGARPSAAIDIYALGATLAWLLAGGGRLPPQHGAVRALLAACLAEDPRQRPSAGTLAAQLQQLSTTLGSDHDEALRLDAGAARFALAPTAAHGPQAVRQWHRARRLALRFPALLVHPDQPPVEPAALDQALRTTARVLRHFPQHAGTLAWRRTLLRATAGTLHGAAAMVQTLGKQEAFGSAASWLAATERLLHTALPLPGGLPRNGDETTSGIGLLQRDPFAFLRRLGAQNEAAANELLQQVQRVQRAEAALDLRGAEAALETMAAHHGGASPTVARRRDQLHRFGFYLDRIARTRDHAERIAALWDRTALQPLLTLITAAEAATQRANRRDHGAGSGGLRSLQFTLVNLAEEFPHLEPVAPALEALSMALAHVTDQAWQQIEAASLSLGAVPVPVRPLQLALGRLDTFRLLEAFVDRPERPRSQLFDRIESLRLSLEQAREARDRLTEGAEHALARGHWTTGLFDMERAVAGLQPADDQERAQAERLQERLAEVRRRKQEVEAAVRRNVELATRYAMLQDDPSSSSAARLQALEERRNGLLFVAMQVPADRAELYRQDLRQVETQLALERAADAEQRLDGTVDPQARLQLARAALAQLTQSAAATDSGHEPSGQVVRLLEHWRTLLAHCQRGVDEQQAVLALRVRQRRKMRLLAMVALLVTSVAIAFALRPWLQGEPAQAGERQQQPR